MKKKCLLATLLILCLLLSACGRTFVPGEETPTTIENVDEQTKPQVSEDEEPAEKPGEQKPVETKTHRITGCGAEEYTMDITLDPQSKAVYGTSVVKLLNTTDEALDEVCFRLYSANISKGTINSASNADTGTEYAVDTKKDPSVIYLPLGDDVIQPGETLSVKLDFESEIPEIDDRLGCFMDEKGMLFNMTFCFPQVAFYEDGKWHEAEYINIGESYCYAMTDYHVTLTAPADYVVVSSGKAETVDGKTVIEAPNVREMAICASNFAQIKTLESDGVTINILAMDYSGIDAQYLSDFYDTVLAVAADSIKMYSGKVGDYIYDELDIIPMKLTSVGGMELPGLIQIAMPTDPNSHDPDLRSIMFPAVVTAHEIGHQWFYCAVSNDTSQEPWLDESLVSYLEYLYMYAYEAGKDAVMAFDAEYAIVYDEEYYGSSFTYGDENDCMDEINRPVYDYSNFDYGMIVYDQGAWFFRELELAMGSDRFFEMLSAWYEENLYQVVTGRAMIDHILEYDASDAVKDIIDEYISEDYL